MIEPTYVFQKGVGWIPQVTGHWVVNSKENGVIHLYDRMPEVGERFAVFSKRDGHYVQDGKIKFEVFVNHLNIANFKIQYYGVHSEGMQFSKDCVYCTMIQE